MSSSKTISQVASDILASFRRNTSYTHLKQNPYPASILAVGLVSSVVIGRLAWEDYKAFLSYGPGGLPYNPFGWLVANFFRMVGIDTLDVRKLEKDPDTRTWLGELKPRDGGRPVLGRHPIPQRQLDQIPAAEIRENFLDKFRALGAQNAHLVKTELSKYEKHTDAIWVRDDSDVYALDKKYNREISHVHNQTDYSAHVVLAPKDGVQVIQKGWGQLHGLAGKLLPQAYVLLYSPRNDDEIEVLLEIVRASIGYMTQTDLSNVKGV